MQPALELAEHARPADERDVRATGREPAADPAADRARSKDDDAWHVRTVLPEARALQKQRSLNDLIKLPERNLQSGKAGYALAWLLGVPLPILLIIYLISRC